MSIRESFRKIIGHVFPGAHSRSFQAARHTRLEDWPISYTTVDQQLKYEYSTIVLRCRDLAQNNEFVTGYLASLRRHVLGSGLKMQCRASDPEIRRTVEENWRKFAARYPGWSTLDERMAATGLDWLVLRALAVDGEAFIRIVWDDESPFGYRYELVDSLLVDVNYSVEPLPDGGAVIMGVQLDSRGRETGYYIRDCLNGNYFSGTRHFVPADEILHVYRKDTARQTRGIPPLSAIAVVLAGLSGYREAEITHARVQACMMGVWERTGTGSGDLLQETDKNGEFLTKMQPGIFTIAPDGYTAKTLQNNSPNNQYAAFNKSLLQSASNSLGVSYNKATGDYESVNYSSLREATLEDNAYFADIQSFLCENWKEIQLRRFLDGLKLNGILDESEMPDAAKAIFTGPQPHWVDPAKELEAKEKEYGMLLGDPISDLEARGIDPEEHLQRLRRWKDLCSKYGVFPSPPAEGSAVQADTEDIENGIQGNI